MRRIFLASVLVLGACSSGQQQTAREAVAASAAVYSASFTAFKLYAGKPRCPAQPVCSDPQKVVTIGQALVAARAAVQLAEGVVDQLPPTTSVTALTADQTKVVNAAAAAAATANTAIGGVK
jgi:hypothetical protein